MSTEFTFPRSAESFQTLRADRPFVIRGVAVAHFAFAGLLFISAFVNNVVEGSNIDQGMAQSLASVDTAPAQTMRRVLQRTGEVKKGLSEHLERRLPSAKKLHALSQTTDIALALLLIVAGSCLLQQQPIGRLLSLVFAGICLAQNLGMMAFLQIAEVPATQRYLEPLIRMYPKDAELIRSVLDPIANAPLNLLLLSVYPLIVIGVMMKPNVKAMFAPPIPQKAPVAEPAHDAPLSSVMPKPPANVEPDPLEALLQRKTF